MAAKLQRRTPGPDNWPAAGAPAGGLHQIDGNDVVINTIDEHGHGVHSIANNGTAGVPVSTAGPAMRV